MYPQLEEALIIYYNEKYFTSQCNLIVNDEIMIDKAKNYFGPMLGITDFKYSMSWFINFKKRYDLKHKKAFGGSGSVDKDEMEKERLRLKQITKDYEPKNI